MFLLVRCVSSSGDDDYLMVDCGTALPEPAPPSTALMRLDGPEYESYRNIFCVETATLQQNKAND